MNSILKVTKYQLHDLLRSKWILFYAVVFFLVTDGLFRFGGDSSQVTLSLMNIVLFIIPIVSIIFSSIYFYNSREFIELLLSQPIARSTIYSGLLVGIAIPQSVVFLIGVGIPFLYHASLSPSLLILLTAGLFLTWIYTGIAFLVASRNDQRIRGIGLSLMIWLATAILYDGFILFLLFALREYPLEKLVLILSLANPIDLGRILMLLQFDIAALMGYTGAVFSKFYGSLLGSLVVISALCLWTGIPSWIGYRTFVRKDF